ncbi:MAG TPA: GntR family transcriptional regulator [Opitutaceae bacterium]|nr:GntR family transcriptional regulator [Opitutaceae bacterium]
MAAPKLTLVRNGQIPVYEQIADHLKARIAAGEFVAGQKLPGIKLLAKSMGVNHLTLRQALRTLEDSRVVATESARGTFVVGNDPSQLQVALVLPNLNESSSRLSAGVQEVMTQSKSTVDIFHYDENDPLEQEQINRLSAEGYDGAIIFPSLNPPSFRPLLQMMLDGYPLVFIDRAPGQFPCWSVWADNFRGGYLATEHLIKAGCSRIACVSTPVSGVQDRYEGFLRAMGDHQLPVDFNLVCQVDPRDERIEEKVDRWIGLSSPPHGIFFTNDFQAFRGVRHARERGKRVPEDLRVVGFDDLSICDLSSPALTTIRQDFTGIGRAAARMLVEQITLPKEKRFSVARHESIPVELVVRGSA